MTLALNNLRMFDMPINKETKKKNIRPVYKVKNKSICKGVPKVL